MPAPISVTIDASRLQAAIRRLPATMDVRIEQALQRSARMVEVRAKATRLFNDRTGELRKSIEAERPSGKWSTGDANVDIVSGGFRAPYAPFVHDGTRRHPIGPRNPNGVLAWPVGNRMAFAKSVVHPGTTPRPYMREGLRAARPFIRSTFRNAVLAAFIDAGFDA
jgi:hypothetical protein